MTDQPAPRLTNTMLMIHAVLTRGLATAKTSCETLPDTAAAHPRSAVSKEQMVELAVEKAFERLVEPSLDVFRVVTHEEVWHEAEGAVEPGAHQPIGKGHCLRPRDVKGDLVRADRTDLHHLDPSEKWPAGLERHDHLTVSELVETIPVAPDPATEGLHKLSAVAVVVPVRQEEYR